MFKYFSFQRILLVVLCVLVFGLGLERHWPEAFKKLTASIPFPVSSPAQSGNRLPASPVLPVFVDRTLAYGLFHRHQQNASGITNIADSLAGGACVFDVDQDGWQDLFIIGGSGARELAESHGIWQKTQGDALFRNIGGKRFELVATYQHDHSMGCAVGDLNQDGREDLIVSHRNGLSIYENQPTGLNPAPYRTAAKSWYTNILLTDINHDGLVDIYASGFITPPEENVTNGGIASNVGFNPVQYDAAPNLLLINHGGLIFTDQTDDFAVRDASGKGLSALSWDINHDGRRDLYTVNANDSGNKVYVTRKSVFNTSQKLRDKSQVFDFRMQTGSRAAIYGPLVDNWNFDLLVSHPEGSLQSLVARSLKPPYFQNVTQSAQFSAVDERYLSVWGNIVADLNNDGWLDVVSRTGKLTPETDTPYLTKRQPDVVAMNLGGQFKKLSLEDMGVVNSLDYSGRGGVYADFDNDGDMDLFLTNNNDAGQLLLNRTPKVADWLGFELVSVDKANGLDMSITVEFQDGTTIRRHSNSRFSFLSYGDKRFLIPASKPVKIVTVNWPDGSESSHDKLALNQYMTIQQKEDISLATLVSLGLEKLDELENRAGKGEKESTTAEDQTDFSLANVFSPKISSDNEISKLFLSETLALDKEPGSLAAWIYQLDAGAIFTESLFAKLSSDPSAGKAFSEQLMYRRPGNAMLAYLPALFQNPSPDVRERTVRALSKWQIDATIPMVLPLLDDDSVAVRCAVNQMMIDLFEQNRTLSDHKWLALPDMVNALGNEPAPCQLRALGASRHHKSLNALLGYLDHPNLIIALTARLSLGELNQPGGFLPMAEDLKRYSQSEPDERKARLALSSIVSLRKLASNQQLEELSEWLLGLSATHVETLLVTFQRYNTPGLALATLQEAVKSHLQPLRQGSIVGGEQLRDLTHLVLLSAIRGIDNRMLYQWQHVQNPGWKDELFNTLISFDDHYPVNINLYWKLAYLLDDEKQQQLYLRQHHLPISNDIAVRWLAGSGEQASRAISRLNGRTLPKRFVELMAMQPSLWSRLVEACQELPYFPEGMEKELLKRAKTSDIVSSRQIACLLRHAEPNEDWRKWLLIATKDQRRTFFKALSANPHLSVKRWLMKTTLLELNAVDGVSAFELDPVIPDMMTVVMMSGPLPGISTMIQMGLEHSDSRIRKHSLDLLCNEPQGYLEPLAKVMLNRWVVAYQSNDDYLNKIERLQRAYPELLDLEHLVQMVRPAQQTNLL